MAAWRQVGGDMTWERHGAVLAKIDGGWVELVRIVPWLEHDHEAAVSHGLYLVDSAAVAVDDLADDQNIDQALRSLGMTRDEYDELSPEYKAQALVDYAGYDDSRSVDALADALPTRAEDIEFWGGRETAEKLEEYDRELRRESLEANFETRFSFGELPASEALAFALGDEPFDMELKGADDVAFQYAMTVAGVPGSTDTPEGFADTIRALAEAPRPGDLADGARTREVDRIVAAWDERYGDPDDEESGIAETARSVASSMLQVLGFEWV
jgi:hypothetical protein